MKRAVSRLACLILGECLRIDLFWPFIVGMIMGIEPNPTQDPQPEPVIAVAEPDIDPDSGNHWVNTQEPEPQVPTGKYTTAIEVRPILETAKNNWVGVVEYEGKDRVYFAHLLRFRRGLWDTRFGINGQTAERGMGMSPCNEESAALNTMKGTANFPPYVAYPSRGAESTYIEIMFDEGTTNFAEFDRNDIVIP